MRADQGLSLMSWNVYSFSIKDKTCRILSKLNRVRLNLIVIVDTRLFSETEAEEKGCYSTPQLTEFQQERSCHIYKKPVFQFLYKKSGPQ